MALGPRLDLRQSQQLVMTPQLQQAIKLLALSNLEIETFVGEALETNPLIEVDAGVTRGEGAEAGERLSSDVSPVDRQVRDGDANADRPLDVDASALDTDRDTGDGALDGSWSARLTVGGPGGEGGPDLENNAGEATTLAEHLDAQVALAGDSPLVVSIARYLIGLLDPAGYLATRLEDVARDLGVSMDHAEDALALVHTLDPTGVGARSLAECIALQAREADRYDPAMARLIDNLDLVARGEIARLKRLCGVDDEDLREMLAELRSYDPKPGLRHGDALASPVVPDVLLADDGKNGWRIQLNEETLPRLVVNRSYYTEVRTGCDDSESRAWLSEKLADANWLIKALDQRQKTILKVASEIVKQQDGFFRKGIAHLKPLTLRAVAEAIEMHESTVSRVTSHKYLACDRGTFELKFFFTSGVASSGGDGGTASAEAVKAAIRKLIDAEQPKAILSDDALVALLKDEGYDLARRTVAKYREAIGLGSSVQRRREKALAAAR